MDGVSEGNDASRYKPPYNTYHTPTEDEWKSIEEIFPGGRRGLIIEALRLQGNAPLEVGKHPDLNSTRVERMNAVLRKKHVMFELKPAFAGEEWDDIHLERVSTNTATPCS